MVGGGGSLEAIFFPKVNEASFAGWGSGIGGSVGAGATFNVDGMWDGSIKEFQGFGIGGGGGVGSKMVGSLAVSYTHAWKLGKLKILLSIFSFSIPAWLFSKEPGQPAQTIQEYYSPRMTKFLYADR